MRVLQINSVCGIGSTGRICTDLAEILEQQGNECKIVYGRELAPEKFERVAHKIGNNLSVKADALIARVFDNAGFNSKAETQKLIKWIKEYEPDIIHLHNIHGYYINIECLFGFLKTYDKPVIWTLHDCWAFTGHCSYFTVAECDKWKEQCFSCPQKGEYPTSVVFDNSKKNYNKKKELFTGLSNLTIVTPSKWLAETAKQSFLGDYEILPIPNGIDLEVFKPRKSDFKEKYSLQNKKIILGSATTWSARKGLHLFGEISELIGDDYMVVAVGVTKEQAKSLPGKLLALPRTNNIEQLAEIYTAADVFVNISKEETMGLTTVEAMACGTPVVTSNYTAVPEVVTESTGVVVENLTAENVIKAIKFVANRTYDLTIEEAKKYEKKQQYLKYIDLYNKVLEK